MAIVRPQSEDRMEALHAALESGTLRHAHRLVNSLHPAEIAHLLESLPPAKRQIVWDMLDPAEEGEVLVQVNEEVRATLIDKMDPGELVAAIEGMDVDDIADLVADLPEAINQQVMLSMDHQDRERLRTVLSYPEDSAGGLMNTDAVTVRPDVTLEVVLRYLRMRGELPEGTDCLFVVNRHDEYLGCLQIVRLLTEEPAKTVAENMDSSIDGILADTPASVVASTFEDLDLVSAPVINDAGRLLGRITVDDVVDVIRDAGEHSFLSMAGLDEEDDLFAGVVTSARRRAVWLGVNLATAFIAAWVVGLFQATIAKVVVLAVLMPIVASMGGIAGSQTLTIMIRGLATGQVERSNARWMVAKEIAVGALNGFAWAMIVAGATVIWFGDWEVAAVIAAAMLINLIIGAIAGVGLPLLMKRLRIDPALAGGVVLTTITDVIGFMALLGLGAAVLT